MPDDLSANFSFEVSAVRRGSHFSQFFPLSRACNKIAAALTIKINIRAVAASNKQQVAAHTVAGVGTDQRSLLNCIVGNSFNQDRQEFVNIYICGQKHFGAEAFNALLKAGHHIVGVSSPALNGEGGTDRLKAAAEENNVPWMKSGLLNENTIPAGVDLIVTAHSHDFVREPTRNKTTYGAIGYHPSLLPIHRGKDAIIWTINMGDKITGGSVYWLNEVMDGGPIAAQEHVFVMPGDTPDGLWKRDLAPLGIKLLTQVCDDIANGKVVKIEQDERIATSEPSIKK